MIQQIKSYLKKYHEANVWIAERETFEDKKLIVEPELAPEVAVYSYSETVPQQQQVVFTRYDKGHNSEETNRIQQLYRELEHLSFSPVLAI